MPAFTQSATTGNSLLDVTGNSTTIGVNYTAQSSTNTATINVGPGYSLTMSGTNSNNTLTIRSRRRADRQRHVDRHQRIEPCVQRLGPSAHDGQWRLGIHPHGQLVRRRFY